MEFMKNGYEFDISEVPKVTQKAHLKVFAEIKSVKHIYKEPVMNKPYHKFLLHRNLEVQKLALEYFL